MNKSLTDIIFVSEKRSKVFMMLHDGPKDIKFLLEQLVK
jgi:predicted transcriptional regulator